jgi:hypothetical protein
VKGIRHPQGSADGTIPEQVEKAVLGNALHLQRDPNDEPTAAPEEQFTSLTGFGSAEVVEQVER